MNERHSALIVEDDREIAEDLQQVLLSIDCESVIVDNSQKALVTLERDSFCLILLDLEIKGDPDAIKGHPEHGRALLRKIRERYSEHTGTAFWLPVLIVSGFAAEVDEAVSLMKDNASDVIQKPFKGPEVSDRIRRALQASLRQTHALCKKPLPSQPLNLEVGIVIAIPGDRIRRRTRVTIAFKPVDLTDASLRVLLHLMIGNQMQEPVHKISLGASNEQGFKGISNLRNELKATLGEVNIIENDYHGNYSLMDNVRIGECSVEKLLKIGDKRISQLAMQLRQDHLRESKSEGNSQKFPSHRQRRQK